jgi:hypothetical protein
MNQWTTILNLLLQHETETYFKVMYNPQNISRSGISSFLSHFVLALSLTYLKDVD